MHIDKDVVFAHIDVDWYEPVKTCLDRIIPKLCIGGSIILDDYYGWSGCRKATDYYFQDISDKFNMDGSAWSKKLPRSRLNGQFNKL
jgi:hypothetical protein